MADKKNRDENESVTGAADERMRGVADDEFEDVDADDMDEEEDEEEGSGAI